MSLVSDELIDGQAVKNYSRRRLSVWLRTRDLLVNQWPVCSSCSFNGQLYPVHTIEQTSSKRPANVEQTSSRHRANSEQTSSRPLPGSNVFL